ncbi:TetR/AcrR family transcriptional regulator [Parablastomonas sp. CN1-191]|uniref:TetR/AcrR family transcriptional regulator n=1 Tax=Parablastomonas sp. CN1-191 TaxID=3400908 RepID=UPI003BF80881
MSERAASDKFARKRAEILEAAAAQINLRGVKGMTLADVARQVGLNTTSVTYYFPRKEQLASAALALALDRLAEDAAEAALEPTPRLRVARLATLAFGHLGRISSGEERPAAYLSDIRALDQSLRIELARRYSEIVMAVADFLELPDTIAAMRAHILLETLHWLPAWTPRYEQADFPRLEARFIEVLCDGISARGAAPWAGPSVSALGAIEASAEATMADEFIRSATLLINQRGYKGASVDAIAAHRNVTKGSFYHHLAGKGDLVLACFERSHSRIAAVQAAALAVPGTFGERLGLALTALVDLQLYSDFPLLRTTALHALPQDVRLQVIDRSNLSARRYAGMMIDGITDGSIAAIDPLVASQVIMAAVNSAAELRRWAQDMTHEAVVADYAAALARGLLAPATKGNPTS